MHWSATVDDVQPSWQVAITQLGTLVSDSWKYTFGMGDLHASNRLPSVLYLVFALSIGALLCALMAAWSSVRMCCRLCGGRKVNRRARGSVQGNLVSDVQRQMYVRDRRKKIK